MKHKNKQNKRKISEDLLVENSSILMYGIYLSFFVCLFVCLPGTSFYHESQRDWAPGLAQACYLGRGHRPSSGSWCTWNRLHKATGSSGDFRAQWWLVTRAAAPSNGYSFGIMSASLPPPSPGFCPLSKLGSPVFLWLQWVASGSSLHPPLFHPSSHRPWAGSGVNVAPASGKKWGSRNSQLVGSRGKNCRS